MAGVVKLPTQPAYTNAQARLISVRAWVDIEDDPIIGRYHPGAALTLLVRKLLCPRLKPFAHRTAQATAKACISALEN